MSAQAVLDPSTPTLSSSRRGPVAALRHLARNLSIGPKLWLLGGFAIVLFAVLAGVGVTSLQSVHNANAKVDRLNAENELVGAVIRPWLWQDDTISKYVDMAAVNDPTSKSLMEAEWKTADEAGQAVLTGIAAAQKAAPNAAIKKEVDALASLLQDYEKNMPQIHAAVQAGQGATVVRGIVTQDSLDQLNAFPAQFEKARVLIADEAASQAAAIESQISHAKTTLLVVAAIALVPRARRAGPHHRRREGRGRASRRGA